ncbi:ion channel [Lutimaribacter sp. EGI FJ00015]|uniref:Ion channel n=1 Tax=Lutimaribacter degradans TaxID=2945989 RepID=A0ACC5ZVS5_9RHOB|nr:ion channel [Lutimaribacter sp. EGI FJ00013]MCM2562432.1 ion channel [Lutimaribacter sp. EGI FJ00013]MCO0613589.1 ion channel [Lutimaribacter sp. EGI FJ00015]MCO0636561.1 ion channel [Lutimaribacter sp. EGI FJ00014]
MAEDRQLKDRVRLLYEGRSKRATRFRYALLLFDAVTIVFFLATAAMPLTPALLVADAVIGSLIALDLILRLWIAENKARFLRRIYVIVDIIVLASLLATPFLGQGLAVLRVIRSLRLIHSYHLMHDLRRDSLLFRRHEDTFVAALNLLVFIFAMTAIVFVLRGQEEPGLTTYVDALYFTVATLTTTGFGDITMTTPTGRLLSVGIMVVGVGLFLQLVRAIFSPAKVKHKCPECGLTKHDVDAIHCKHCGHDLKIETEGAL